MHTVSHVKVPKYCHHRARGLGYVRLGGKVKYLGRFETPESKAEYRRLLGQWLGASPQAPAAALALPPPPMPSPLRDEEMTVREFCLAYLKHAQVRYEKNRYSGIKNAFIALDRLFGELPISDLGPKRLKAVRDVFVQRGLKRGIVNRRAKYIARGVRWAVSEELIAGEVLHRLMAVEILRRGEAPIPESEKVKSVDEALVVETIKHTSGEVAAMAKLQLLTGARSGEIVLMRAADIDMTEEVWKYRPEHHKTENHGHERVVAIGPRAQAILRPFLTGSPQRYIFSPAKAEKRRRQALHQGRVTPESCGNNIGTHRTDDPDRKPGERYTSGSYQRAIARGIEKAFPLPEHLAPRTIIPTGRKKTPRPETKNEWWSRLTKAERAAVKAWRKRHHWHAHQLRHNAATRLRRTFGLDEI